MLPVQAQGVIMPSGCSSLQQNLHCFSIKRFSTKKGGQTGVLLYLFMTLLFCIFGIFLVLQTLQLVLLLYILYKLQQDKNSAVTFCKQVWFQL